jgi:hypothetical protein
LSVTWLRRAFDWDVTAIPRENVTRTQNSHPISLATLDDRVLKIISTKNELDFALYRNAVRRLMTQVTDHSTGLRNAIFQGARSVVHYSQKNDQIHRQSFPKNQPQFSNFLESQVFVTNE